MMTSANDARLESESSPSSNPALLTVNDLVVHFPVRGGGLVHALDGVSLSVNTGETVGLVGESGSGKSTLGMAVLRKTPITSGSVEFNGQDITHSSRSDLRRLRRDIQMVFQDPYASLNPRMKVAELVAEPLIVHKVAKRGPELRETVASLVERCGLSRAALSQYPTAFSGGERQRIAIARALALKPRLIVADEAVSALDVSIQAQIVNLFRDLQLSEQISFLFISHNLAVVRQVADRLVILYAGQVLETGLASEIFQRALHPYTLALLSASPLPDPKAERSRERIILRGDPPDALSPEPGCRFRSRCPWAMDGCERTQVLEEKEPGRFAACWRVPSVHKARPTAPLDSHNFLQLAQG